MVTDNEQGHAHTGGVGEPDVKFYSDMISTLVFKVKRMRDAQAMYFRHRNDTDKKKAMGFEQDVDKYINLLRNRGFGKDIEQKKQGLEGKPGTLFGE